MPIAIGLGLGVAGSVMASEVLESLLFGVQPGEPGTALAAGVVLAAVAWAATFIPAYRATGVEAGLVMRAE